MLIVFKFFLKKNIGMLLLSASVLISFFFALNVPKNIEIKKVISSIQVEDDNIYVYEDIENDKVIYKIITKNDLGRNDVIKDSKLYDSVPSELEVGIWVLFSILTLVLIALSFSDTWHYKECKYSAMDSLIYCVLEDDIYYYFIDDILLFKKNGDRFYGDSLTEHLGLHKMSQLRKYPKFQTKTQKREKALNAIVV